ncbi:MAG: precorrin-6A reductase [Desulfurispora sp.]|uniref:precorrin-6A reductase n=1 Tax=Desulfurispora sp. TaxID=3014275 RepID=UPI00404B6248
MILLLGGTAETHQILAGLLSRALPVIVSTATPLGKKLLEEHLPPRVLSGGPVEVRCGRLDASGLVELIQKRGIRLVVDATHPYAGEVSRQALLACRETGITCLRFSRPRQEPGQYRLVYRVPDYLSAARRAGELGFRIFLTTGSKTVPIFAGELDPQRLIVRVLPDPQTIAGLLEIGIPARQIIAAQGPFSRELNLAMFRDWRADVVVSKQSGAAGGQEAKLAAARQLDLPVVLIERPPEIGPVQVFEDVAELLRTVQELYPDSE